MDNIVNTMKEEIIKRSNNFEKSTQGTKDEYNLYKEHIQYVYEYAILISKDKSVDMEVVKLSALLHDISMTDKDLERSKHNEYSAIIAENLLKDNNISEEKIKKVKNCIYNHSSKRKQYRTTLEEQILVDADSLSHFDNILSIYSLGHNVIGLNEENSIKFVKDKLTRDYNEISDSTKTIIKNKYEKIMFITTYKELKKVNKQIDKKKGNL